MTIKNLTNEIFEKSFSRESLERLLIREIKKKLEYLWEIIPEDAPVDVKSNEYISETLKSE